MSLLDKVKLSNDDVTHLQNLYNRKENKFSSMEEFKAEAKFLAALTFCDDLQEMQNLASETLKIPNFNSKNRTYQEILDMVNERLDLLKGTGILE
jgi:hypothetical protein